MAYCPKCQEQRPEVGRFCAKCGAELVGPAGQQPGAAPPGVPQQYAPPAYQYGSSAGTNLSAGLWVVVIGGAVAALFTIVQWINFFSQINQLTGGSGPPPDFPTGAYHTVFLLLLAMFVACTILGLQAGSLTGRGRSIRDCVVLGLSGLWPVGLVFALVIMAVAQAPMGDVDMGILILLGGIAQAVGAMVDLVNTA